MKLKEIAAHTYLGALHYYIGGYKGSKNIGCFLCWFNQSLSSSLHQCLINMQNIDEDSFDKVHLWQERPSLSYCIW